MAVGITTRLILAPFSGHGDNEAFFLSAQHFLFAGFDFYYFTSTRAGAWVYPPVWLWITTGTYLASSSPPTYFTPLFLLLMKAPLIIADVIVAYVLYTLLGGKKGRFAAGFWLLNPMSIFITSIFGQFDPLVPAFLALSVLGLTRSKISAGGILYGTAVMTKQHAIFAAPILAACVYRKNGRNCALKFALASIVACFFISLPFLLSGARQIYLRDVWMTRSGVDYDDLYCQFAGIFQFLSWIHDRFKIELLSLFSLSYPMLFFMLGTATGMTFLCRKIDYMRACLMSTAAFLTLSWYVNPQYLVIFMPFMIYDVLAHNESRLWLVTVLLPFLWPLSTDIGGTYFKDSSLILIPPLIGDSGIAISSLVFFIFLSTYVISRMAECFESNGLGATDGH